MGGSIARSYRDTPRQAYDLVFIYGPQIPKEPEYLDGDLLNVQSFNTKAFVAYLDGRKSTRLNLMRLMPGARFKHNALHKWTRIDIPEKAQRR